MSGGWGPIYYPLGLFCVLWLTSICLLGLSYPAGLTCGGLLIACAISRASLQIFSMNQGPRNRNWTILSCNIRGINSNNGKWDAVKSKVSESKCDILCLQETKKEFFDLAYVKKFCPPCMDDFVFLPSVGNSGGSLIAWNTSRMHTHSQLSFHAS